MSAYSAFGPRGASTSYQYGSASLADYDFMPPQEEEGEELVDRGLSSHVPVEERAPQEIPGWGVEGGTEPQMKQQQQQSLLQRPQGAGVRTEDASVREAAVEILPMIFANPPSIPAALKSSELNQRHTLLRISPHDIDDYLVTGGPTSQPDTPTRVINALDELRGHVEELAGFHLIPQDALAGIIQDVRWQSPEEGTFLASVGLGYGNARGGSLAMILKREESDDDAPGWKFHNLLPLEAAPGRWQASLNSVLCRNSEERALTDESQSQLPVQAPPSGQREKEERRETLAATSKTSAPFAAMSETGNGTTFAAAEEAEDEDGEAKKAQHLYTNAEDFWGGWEGEDGHSGDGGAGAGDANSAAAPEEGEEEDHYWDSYGAQGAPDEDQQDRGAAEIQGSTDLGATSVAAAPAPDPALANVGQASSRTATDIDTHTHTATPTSHRARRNGHARGLLRSLVGLVQEGPEPVSEDEFLQWAREAFRENQLYRESVAGGEAGAVGERR